MARDEVLSMVARARDDASGPLRRIENALRGIGKRGNAESKQLLNDFKKVQTGLRSVGKQGHDETKVLREGFRSVRRELDKAAEVAKTGMSPALDAIGISSLTAVGAVAALVSGLKNFADQGADVAAFGRRVQLTTNTIRGLEGVAEKFHVDPGAIRAGEQSFADAMFQIRRRRGEIYRHLLAQRHDFAVELASTPETPEGNERALKNFLHVLEDVKRVHGEPTARMFSKEVFGTDVFVDLLRKGNAGLEEAVKLTLKLRGAMNESAGEEWESNWSDFKAAIEGVRNEVGNDLLPQLTELARDGGDFFAQNKVAIAHDIADSVRAIGAALRDVNSGVEAIGGWKTVFEGMIALKLGGLAVRIGRVVSALGGFAGLGAPPGWVLSMLGISAALGAETQSAVAALPPAARKELHDNSTLATMDPDLAMGAAIMDAAAPPTQPEASRAPGAPVGWHAVRRATSRSWWTPDRVSHAIDYLKEHAGLTDIGAQALVARWAGVKSTGAGPSAVNPVSGAIGIEQDLGSRKAGVVLGDFDGQLAHAADELKTTEARAWRMLMAARTPQEAAIGASQFERAEGYNPATGADNFVGQTVATMNDIIRDREGDSARAGSLLSAANKRAMDGMAASMTGSASISVDVKAPRGTSVKADADGMFDKIEVNRGLSMPIAD